MNQSGLAASFSDRLLKRFQIGLDWIHTWTSVIKPCRFSLIMVGAGAFFLLLVPQGQDLLRGQAERTGKILEIHECRWYTYSY